MVVWRHPVAPPLPPAFSHISPFLCFSHILLTTVMFCFLGSCLSIQIWVSNNDLSQSLPVECCLCGAMLHCAPCLFLLDECLSRCTFLALFASNSFEFYRPLRTKASIATASICSTEMALEDMYKRLPALSFSNREAFFNFKL